MNNMQIVYMMGNLKMLRKRQLKHLKKLKSGHGNRANKLHKRSAGILHCMSTLFLLENLLIHVQFLFPPLQLRFLPLFQIPNWN